MARATALAGVALLTARPFDIAFVDIGLPSLDGYQLAAAARAKRVGTFLVAMTGYRQPEDRR
ncbi:MAG: hypothetical protein JNL83_00075 [Myxococcales bacterium]|nr:hypothetical protein [Myxococcales bacterium]